MFPAEKFRRIVVSVLLMVTLFSANAIAEEQAKETKADRDQRMAWWRDARFGMFIHWGIYTIPAGNWNGHRIDGLGEWIMSRAKIPIADYDKFAEQFNPVKFDADRWVKLAKQAGMKYIIITSKHHDGFAMFRSQASPFNVYDATPFHRDPLKELADACQKHGMKLGFYYSQAQDWHHPGGAAGHGRWDKAQEGDMDKYLHDVALPQVREILSNYGPISVLWWDTPYDMSSARAAMFKPLLKLQPGIITNNRLGYRELGDTETPEGHIPPTGIPGRDWETCMTMNDTWGFKDYANEWLSAETLVRQLIEVASKGGNYLLNVGPTAEGLIPQPSVERLEVIGKWMDINSESIYGSSASPFKKLPWGRCTQKPGKLYLHVFDWPKGELVVPGLTNNVTRAYLLADAQKSPLAVKRSGDNDITITLPTSAPDAMASVVVLDIEGEPNVVLRRIQQNADGKIELTAENADLQGRGQICYEAGSKRGNIGRWWKVEDFVTWDFEVKTPGTFDVEIVYSCPDSSRGSAYNVQVASQTLYSKVVDTGGWGTFKPYKLGTIRLTGAHTLAVEATRKPESAVMKLRGVTLTPTKP